MQWRWLCVTAKAGSESSIQLPPHSLISQDTTFGAMNSHGRIPAPLQMLDWSHYVNRPHEIEKNSPGAPAVPVPAVWASPAQVPDMRVEKSSSWHQLQGSLSATTGGNPCENHPYESSQPPGLWEIIINDYFCFMPLSLGSFDMQQSITKTNWLKLEQVYAPWSSKGFPRFLLVLGGIDWIVHCGFCPQMH